MHFFYCEWSFDFTSTKIYSIIIFSEKQNPHIPQQSSFYNPNYDLATGLFVRNDLPAVGEEMEIDGEGRKWIYIGVPPRSIGMPSGKNMEQKTLNAFIYGLITPAFLLIVGLLMIYLGSKKKK